MRFVIKKFVLCQCVKNRLTDFRFTCTSIAWHSLVDSLSRNCR